MLTALGRNQHGAHQHNQPRTERDCYDCDDRAHARNIGRFVTQLKVLLPMHA